MAGILDGIGGWLSNDTNRTRLAGVSQVLGALDRGQAPDVAPFLGAIQQQQQAQQFRDSLGSEDMMGRFSDEERSFLAGLPPQVAQQLIAERIFAKPEPTTYGWQTMPDGTLVRTDSTGGFAPVGSFGKPEAAPKPVYEGGQWWDTSGGQPVPLTEAAPGARPMSAKEREKWGIPQEMGPVAMTDTGPKVIGGGGVSVNLGTGDPQWGQAPNDHVWLRGPDGQVVTEPDPSGRGVRPVAVPIAGSKAEAEAQESKIVSQQAADQAGQMLATIDGILNDPALDNSTGLLSWTQRIPGTPGYRFGTRARQLEGQAFLQAFESLKGGGQITEIEGQKATQAIGRLDTAQSAADYRDALSELREILLTAQARAMGQAVPEGGADGAPAQVVNDADYEALPSGAVFIGPDGVTRRKP